MWNVLAHLRSVVTASLLLSLAACGGGGGGGGGDGGGSGGLSLSTDSISIEAPLGAPEPAQRYVTGTLAGVTGTVYIFVQYTDTGLMVVDFTQTGEQTGELWVRFKGTEQAGPGVHRDVITVNVCRDPECTRHVRNSPRQVNVEYRVQESGSFTMNPANLQLRQIEGTRPELAPLSLSYSGGNVQRYTATVEYGSGNGWLSVSPSAGPINSLPAQLQPQLQALPGGTYTATLVLRSNGGTVEKRVPVRYEVLPARTDPSAIEFTVGLQTTAAEMRRNLRPLPAFDNSGTPGGTDYTVSADVDWLAVSPTSGNSASATPLEVRVVPAGLSKLDHGRHTGRLQFVPTKAGASKFSVPVYLDLRLPRVGWAVPRVIAPNRSQAVSIYGKGFAALSGHTLIAGDQSLTSYEVVDDSELRVVLPGLPAGRQPLYLDDPFGGAPDLAALSVAAPIPEGLYASDVSSPSLGDGGSGRATVFDEGRRAFFVLTEYSNGGPIDPANIHALQRWRFTGKRWVNSVLKLPGYCSGLFMSPDGKELLLTSGQAVYHVDPDRMTLTATVLPADYYLYTSNGLHGMLANGQLFSVLTPEYYTGIPQGIARYYDIRARRFTTVPQSVPYLQLNPSSASSRMIGTPNGKTLLLSEYAGGFGNAQISRIDSTGRLADTRASISDDLPTHASADGRVVATTSTDGQVLRFEGSSIVGGNIMASGTVGGFGVGEPGQGPIRVSPDGTRLYLLFYESSRGNSLLTVDLTKAPPFPVIGRRPTDVSNYFGFFLGASGDRVYALGYDSMEVLTVP